MNYTLAEVLFILTVGTTCLILGLSFIYQKDRVWPYYVTLAKAFGRHVEQRSAWWENFSTLSGILTVFFGSFWLTLMLIAFISTVIL